MKFIKQILFYLYINIYFSCLITIATRSLQLLLIRYWGPVSQHLVTLQRKPNARQVTDIKSVILLEIKT